MYRVQREKERGSERVRENSVCGKFEGECCVMTTTTTTTARQTLVASEGKSKRRKSDGKSSGADEPQYCKGM